MTASARPPKRFLHGAAGRAFPAAVQRAPAILVAVWLLAGSAAHVFAAVFTEDQAVERALASSPDLAYQGALLSAQELAFALGIREYFPRFSLGYDENDTITIGAPDTWGKTISFSATQPLLRGGTKPYERRAARMDLAIARGDLEQRYRSLEHDLRRAFAEVLVAQQKQEILRRTIDLAHQNIEILQTQVRLGEALELDSAQAELELLSLEITLSQTETSLEDSRYQIKKLLSLDPAETLELRGSLDPLAPGLELVGLEQRLFSMAVSYSLDLKRQDTTVQKAAIQVRAAAFPFVPDVDLELSAEFTGDAFPLRVPRYSGKITFNFAVPESPTTYSAGASITPGQDRGGSASLKTSPGESVTAWLDRKTAILSLDAETRRREEITQDLRFQVTRMVAAYSQTTQTVELARKKLEVERRKEAILRKQMNLGEVNRIDYLQGAIETANAEIALNETALQLVQGERDWENLLGLESGGLRAMVEKAKVATQ